MTHQAEGLTPVARSRTCGLRGRVALEQLVEIAEHVLALGGGHERGRQPSREAWRTTVHSPTSDSMPAVMRLSDAIDCFSAR